MFDASLNILGWFADAGILSWFDDDLLPAGTPGTPAVGLGWGMGPSILIGR